MCKVTWEIQLEEKGQLQHCKISYKVDMVGNVGISYIIESNIIASAWIKKRLLRYPPL